MALKTITYDDETHKLVPRIATREMVLAMLQGTYPADFGLGAKLQQEAAKNWQAALSASPPPPQGESRSDKP